MENILHIDPVLENRLSLGCEPVDHPGSVISANGLLSDNHTDVHKLGDDLLQLAVGDALNAIHDPREPFLLGDGFDHVHPHFEWTSTTTAGNIA